MHYITSQLRARLGMAILLPVAVACGTADKKSNDAGAAATTTTAAAPTNTELSLDYFVNNKVVTEKDVGSLVIGAKKDLFFLAKNKSTADVSGIKVSGIADPFKHAADNCDKTLKSGEECVVHVTFQPGEAKEYTLKLKLAFTVAGQALSSEREVTGKGLTAASLALSDSAFAFGSVAAMATSDKVFTLTNSGQSFAQEVKINSLNAPFSNKTTGATGTVTNCGTILAPTSSCSVVVAFAPTAAGTFNDVLVISYNDGKTTRSVQVTLSGTSP